VTDPRVLSQVVDVSPHVAPVALEIGAIFDAHFDYVWNTLRRLGVREFDLEDLSHEVFLKVHARLADYDAARPMRPWLFGFAYRVAADHRRLARHRLEVLGAPVEAVDPVRPPDERIEADEERALVEAALAELDFDRRAVIMLHDVEDVPVPAIAAELGIPVNTAYSRLRLAREDLAAAVTRQRRKTRMTGPAGAWPRPGAGDLARPRATPRRGAL
jgi:RNA polymerase sigma-70 factor, ECF subfamily